MNRHKDDAWEEAKRRCHLNEEDVRMAKELGFQPKSLIKNIPSRSEQWKAPINEWVRSLYQKKIGSRKPKAAPAAANTGGKTAGATGRPAVLEFRNPEYPWPDRPAIPGLRPYVPPELEDEEDDGEDDGGWGFEFTFGNRFEPPSDEDIDEQDALLLRRQRLFRWAAQSIAVAMSGVPEVRRVAAFGAVAQPLEKEVPRFREYRRHHIQVFHECADLDLAVWMTSVDKLPDLKKALQRGVAFVQNTPYGGVAHHQVDVHILEDGTSAYRGRLCFFGECPKARKIECLVPGCGAAPFLRQFERYHFQPPRFEAAPKVVLFDRPSGFLVRLPETEVELEVPVARIEDDDDVPF